MDKLPQRVSNLRIEYGWTQDQLAKACGLHTTAISHIEAAARKPSVGTLVKLARGLKVSTDHLLGLEMRSSMAYEHLCGWAIGLCERDQRLLADLAHCMDKREVIESLKKFPVKHVD